MSHLASFVASSARVYRSYLRVIEPRDARKRTSNFNLFPANVMQALVVGQTASSQVAIPSSPGVNKTYLPDKRMSAISEVMIDNQTSRASYLPFAIV